jgi:hypothetical protein
MNTSFEPIVDLTIDDDEVKRRTGYISLDTMLIYIFIVCNGDVNVILSRSTSLSGLRTLNISGVEQLQGYGMDENYLAYQVNSFMQ